MPLSKLQCDHAKPGDKNYSLADGDGMSLSVRKTGRKVWEFRYRFDGKEERLMMGDYPALPLKSARAMRAQMREALAKGLDPRALDDASFKSKTFSHAAEFWFHKEQDRWSHGFAGRVWNRVARDLLPSLGHTPLTEVTRSDVIAALRSVEDRGAIETARRIGGYARDIFSLAISEEWCDVNPAMDLTKSLKPKPKVRHNPRLKLDQLPEFFNKLNDYEGEEETRIALKLILHTFVRTKELVGKTDGGVRTHGLRAEEVDLVGKVWRIPADRMKMGTEHIVPLTDTTEALFRRLIERAEPGEPLLNMSNNTMIFALYRMGYHTKATVHGFRSTASTALNECGLFRGEVIEKQLSHEEKNEVRAAYNAAEYLNERRTLMHWWSALLDKAEAGGEAEPYIDLLGTGPAEPADPDKFVDLLS
nr:integrase arm-type DNA-binding domain-containing protein [Sagittula stellata]